MLPRDGDFTPLLFFPLFQEQEGTRLAHAGSKLWNAWYTPRQEAFSRTAFLASVVALSGIELIFLLVAVTVLCFEFNVRTMLITC